MSNLQQELARWRGAGIIDQKTSERIAEFERKHRPARSAQPVLVELFAYLGLVIVVAGVVVLAAANWEHMSGWMRVAVLALPGAALVPLGRLLASSREPGLQRGGAMAWLLSLVLLTGAAGVAGYEAGWERESAALAAGIAGMGFAIALWWFNRGDVQVLGLAAAAMLLAISVAARMAEFLSDLNTATLFGGTVVILFVSGSVLVRLGVLRPELTAGMLSILGFAFGAMYFSAAFAGRFDEQRFAIGFGAALLVLSAWAIAGARTKVLIPHLLAGVLAQLGVGLSAVFFATGLGVELASDEYAPAVAGLIVMGFAAAHIALCETGVVIPRLMARLLATAGMIGGSVAVSVPDGPPPAEAIPLLIGAALIVLSLDRSTFIYMAAGIAAIAVGLVMPVIRHVEDPTVAALLMIAIGLLVLAALALLVRYRPWSGGGRGSHSWPAGMHPR